MGISPSGPLPFWRPKFCLTRLPMFCLDLAEAALRSASFGKRS